MMADFKMKFMKLRKLLNLGIFFFSGTHIEDLK